MQLNPAGSLGARILWQMAVRIAVVIGLVTLASYWHVYRSATLTGIGTLTKYVHERGERESQLFLLAQDNLTVLMADFLNKQGKDASGSENKAFAAAFGRAWHNRFDSVFFASLDGLAATYVPDSDWYRNIPPNVRFTDYPWVKIVLPENNPDRTFRWTGIWYDEITQSFAATCLLPADIDGQFRYYAGISVRLNDIIDRTRQTGLDGTWNLIFRADGTLVSHPDDRVMATLRDNKGEFSIPTSGDAHLKAIFDATALTTGDGVITLDAFDEYLGVAHIKGPDWYFVSVLPKKVLSRPAESTARMILWLGLAALLLELAIVGWIIRRQVSRPLAEVMQRLAAFGKGHSGTRMASEGSDELAQLGRTFNQMAQTLEEGQRQLRDHAASLESKVSERTQQLQDKDRAKTRFLAAASHDLRQPIQAASLFIDNLKHSPLDKAQRQTVAYLDLSISSLRELLDGLLDISKLDADAVTPERVGISVQQMFATLDTEFAPQAHARGLRLAAHCPHPGMRVQSDPQLLMTILRNLVANAVKYTERGGILMGARKRGDHVALQVWDTGIGMHQEHLERIYDEFYQIDNRQRDRSKGFGIGLSIASRSARLLGYALHCESRPGQGTRFELILPFVPAGLEVLTHPLSAVQHQLGGLHIVVVEDDPLVAESLVLWLEDAGSLVCLYGSAEQALADANCIQADVHISDYRLPGAIDGIRFLDTVCLRAGHAIRGILITGDTSPEFIGQAGQSGWRVLFKPVDPALLRAAING